MVADIWVIQNNEIAKLRVRRGWRGKLVLQVCNRQTRTRNPFLDPEPAGFSPWRDANANDPAEVARVMELMQPNYK
jgi:hypothetical protein